ncbi:uncharacterized protein DNG_06521 [Cephalotrichum gorgonifer]|uniref:Uncharacterized protein n=1 Tax=Cephalotrichum gorgonifer TaxID=2041049 RepID=A0AAE8SWM8_9PEZI|nr:uncharacterized protein DNG_06521 [Cephalotrichum gorgonifer]
MENSPAESTSYGFPDTPRTPASHLCVKNESRNASPSPDAVSMGAPSPPGTASRQARNTSNKPKAKPRSVANMTQEQRDRKRENDRVAQRAIRRKTKCRIAELEAIIEQLKSSDHNKELQAAIEAKQAAEAENIEIKRQLGNIMATLRDLIAPRQTVPEEHAYASPASQVCPTAHPMPGPLPNMASTPTSITSPAAAFDGQSRSSVQKEAIIPQASHHTQEVMPQREGIQRGLEIRGDRIDLSFLVTRPGSIPSFLTTNPDSGSDAAGSSAPAGGGIAGRSQRLPYPYYNSSTQHQYDPQVQQRPPPAHHGPDLSHRLPTPQALSIPSLNQHRLRPTMAQNGPATYPNPQQQPAWAAAPSILNVAASTVLDNILLQFLKERRDLIAQGQPPAEVVGPRYPTVSSLLNKDPTSVHPLTSIFTGIIGTFPDLKRLPEQLATVYLMFLNMRWQVDPTRENYDHLLPFMRPVPVQYTIPHHAWFDHVPFPRMRDIMIRNPAEYPLDDLFVPYTKTLSVNWPYDDYHVLIRNPETDEITINPVFDLHVRNIDNWSLGEEFRVRFPGLDGTYVYRDVTGSRGTRP